MPAPVDIQKHTFTSPKFESVIKEAMRFMLASPIHLLPPAEPFPGAGVYALYYCGNFKHYQHIAATEQKNAKTPIYVGKAVPPGWRMGRVGRSGPNIRPLFRRIAEHAGNIEDATNLQSGDFCCRFMLLGGAVADLISACEAQLIRNHKPLWNTVIDGFGNHTPGKGRFDQAKSEWDVLHPGREWAKKCRGTPPVLKDIVAQIKKHRDG